MLIKAHTIIINDNTDTGFQHFPNIQYTSSGIRVGYEYFPVTQNSLGQIIKQENKFSTNRKFNVSFIKEFIVDNNNDYFQPFYKWITYNCRNNKIEENNKCGEFSSLVLIKQQTEYSEYLLLNVRCPMPVIYWRDVEDLYENKYSKKIEDHDFKDMKNELETKYQEYKNNNLSDAGCDILLPHSESNRGQFLIAMANGAEFEIVVQRQKIDGQKMIPNKYIVSCNNGEINIANPRHIANLILK